MESVPGAEVVLVNTEKENGGLGKLELVWFVRKEKSTDVGLFHETL